MLKRNRLTTFIIAAAAVVSMLPSNAYAAENSKIISSKGQLYNAVAYNNGQSYIAGEPKGKDEASYYYNAGTYKKLNDVDSDDKISLYGSKYINVSDGEYFIDLSSGKVIEDKVIKNAEDDAAVNFRKTLRNSNDGRYDNNDVNDIKELTELPKSKFTDGWYSVEYKPKEVSSEINGGAEKITVYTDNNGKYIDSDYNIGKVKVKLSNSKTANLDNTNESDEKVRASVKSDKVIAQDSNNIYRLAKITIRSEQSGVTIKSINGIEISDDTDVFSVNSEENEVSYDVLQVISKVQSSEKVDGIRYAKTVTSYMICDKSGKKVSLFNDGADAFTVADGKLINYELSGDYIEAEVINFKSKSSLYYIDRGNSGKVKLQGKESAVDIDVEGNIWALTDGYIRKFDNDESFTKVYSLEKEYDNLSVYDKDNIIVWNSDDDIYGILDKEAQKDEEAEGEEVVVPSNPENNNGNTQVNPPNNNSNTVIKEGWAQNSSDNSWTYINADGSKHKGWLSSNGSWYYMDSQTGIMKTGWLSDGGSWYYLNANGDMKTGWLKDTNGKWYYMQGNGSMKTGWLSDGGKWYYLNSDGSMAYNTTIGSYRLGSDGAWIK